LRALPRQYKYSSRKTAILSSFTPWGKPFKQTSFSKTYTSALLRQKPYSFAIIA
jgi:hypothetical protein